MLYHNALVKQIEENAPAMIPPINGTVNSLNELTPKSNNIKIIINVVTEVLMLRLTV